MMDKTWGHSVNQNGVKKGVVRNSFSFPKSVVWGPSGIVAMIETLSQKVFEVDEEDEKKTERKIALDDSEYLAVFGSENAIKYRKNGTFYIEKVTLIINEKKKPPNKTEKKKEQSYVKIDYECKVNGRLKRPNGEWQWLRVGQ